MLPKTGLFLFCLIISSIFGCIPTESPEDEIITTSTTSTSLSASTTPSSTTSTSTTSTTTSPTTTSSTTTTTTTTTATTSAPFCDPDWIYFATTDSCYFLGVGLGLDFLPAETYCENIWGATLASIHSDAENDFIVGLAPEENAYMIIGLRRFPPACNGRYTNYDGSALDYTMWATNNPDYVTGNENCVGMQLADIPGNLRGQWNNRNCNCPPGPNCPSKYVVCKKPRL